MGSPGDGFGGSIVVVVPALNPDGLVANTRQKAKVDLNRNLITTNWGQATDIAEKELGHPYYGGPAPGSEPETQWLMQLMAHYCPQGILSLHTPYAVVNWDGPVSSGGVSPAQQWAEALSAVTGYPVTDDIGYPTPGSLGTYAGVERHIPVITLELAEAFNQPNPSHALQGLWQTHQSVIQTSLAQPFLHAPIGQQQGLLA
ncbi:MAG: M14 family zinc carboxypeptidase [Vampirovibrionales bacterium]